MESTNRYGTIDFSKVYNRNLGSALVISVGLHLMLIGLYLISTMDGATAADDTRIWDGGTVLTDVGTAHDKLPIVTPPTREPAGISGISSVTGNFKPVLDALVPDSAAPIATVAETPHAFALPGVPTGEPLDVNCGPAAPLVVTAPVVIGETERDPDPTELILDATDPQLDYDLLKSRLIYPDMARKNGIEGMVVVRVLIDRTGRPQRFLIEHSENRILDQAAADAVMSMQFTPAVQNGVPIKVWVSVPIRFELR